MRRMLMVGIAMLVALAAGAAPPEATTRLLEVALEALDEDRFAGSYRLTTSAVVTKPDGSDREESLDVMEVRQQKGVTPEIVVVSAVENGKDLTSKRREELASQRAKEEKETGKRDADDDGGSLSASMRLPLGSDLALFEFGPAEADGGVLKASFAPRPSARKEKNITRGTLAWDKASGEPRWLEATYVDPPTGVKELVMRFEIGRQDNLLYLRRTTTKGVGRMLWIKRAFDIEITISDLAQAPAESSETAR